MKYPDIAKEIIEMARVDQEMRETAAHNPNKWDISVDWHNTKRMKVIVAKIGWPNIVKVGQEAAHMAWLLVQHADHHVAFQKQCLALLLREPKEEIQPREIGYLEDRIRVSEGRPQLYGTQFFLDNDTKTFQPRPIEDLEGLADRRATLGMEPFEDYEKRLRERYDACVPKRAA